MAMPARLHVERHQDARSGRQRPHVDHQDRRVDAVDAAPGAPGQVVQDRVVCGRATATGTAAPTTLSFSGGAVGTTPVAVNLTTTGAARPACRYRRRQPDRRPSTARRSLDRSRDIIGHDRDPRRRHADGDTATIPLMPLGDRDQTAPSTGRRHWLTAGFTATDVGADASVNGQPSSTSRTNWRRRRRRRSPTAYRHRHRRRCRSTNGRAFGRCSCVTAKTVDALVTEINANTSPEGQDPRLQRQRQAAHREPLDRQT